jgi:hypothetical protein
MVSRKVQKRVGSSALSKQRGKDLNLNSSYAHDSRNTTPYTLQQPYRSVDPDTLWMKLSRNEYHG